MKVIMKDSVVGCVTFSPCGRFVAFTSSPKTTVPHSSSVMIWDDASSSVMRQVRGGLHVGVSAIT